MRRTQSLLLAVGLALAVGSCAVSRQVIRLRDSRAASHVVSDSPAVSLGYLTADSLVLLSSEGRVVKPPGLAIAGYTTADRTSHDFDGFVHRAGDSLVFHRPERGRGLEAPVPSAAFVLPVAEVHSVTVWRPDAGKSALLLLTGAVVPTGIVLWAFGQPREESLM